MVSYSWSLSAGQSFDKQALFELQTSLVALGIYLDLSWDGNSPQLSISAPEVTSHTEVPTKAATEQNPSVPRESGSDSLQGITTNPAQKPWPGYAIQRMEIILLERAINTRILALSIFMALLAQIKSATLGSARHNQAPCLKLI